ncbi:hypothetical protein [Halococcus saccharolyticus]|uniref:Transcription anti-termination factor n=1 Tax=Halococcus saccharolyticus DSM 5350 TaxID=1227455 RepID=M0MC66_9EURY|nr:hypothetical protein [Halococcus saccharolyticus]EMA43362.1 hypothetical protein C449_15327 [Halococcus saccharolyticus DSM 5350]
MDGETLIDDVRDAKATRLDRLGGTKWLLAATGADLETERVLRVAAASEAAAATTFEQWADDEGSDRAREAFASVAALERDHAARVTDHLDEDPESGADPEPDAAPSALHEHLRSLDDTSKRVGAGLVGRPLVSDRTTVQIVSFFVNEADERRADLFRELRTETGELLDEGATVLDAVCTTDDDWERACEAATGTIDVAYDEFAGDLDAMGLDPRSIC